MGARDALATRGLRQLSKTSLWILQQQRFGEAKNFVAFLEKPVVSVPILFNIFLFTVPVIAIGLNENLVEGQEEVHDVSTHAFLGFKEKPSPLEFFSNYSLKGSITWMHILARGYCHACARMTTKATGSCFNPACLAPKGTPTHLTHSRRHGSTDSFASETAIEFSCGMTLSNLKGFPALKTHLCDTVVPAKLSTLLTTVEAPPVFKTGEENTKYLAASFASMLNTGGFHFKHYNIQALGQEYQQPWERN